MEADLRRQAAFVQASVPVYARLFALLEAALDRGLRSRLQAAWASRSFEAFYDRLLLLAAALRASALR